MPAGNRSRVPEGRASSSRPPPLRPVRGSGAERYHPNRLQSQALPRRPLLRLVHGALSWLRHERPRLLPQPVDPVPQVAERQHPLLRELPLAEIARLEVRHHLRPLCSVLVGHVAPPRCERGGSPSAVTAARRPFPDGYGQRASPLRNLERTRSWVVEAVHASLHRATQLHVSLDAFWTQFQTVPPSDSQSDNPGPAPPSKRAQQEGICLSRKKAHGDLRLKNPIAEPEKSVCRRAWPQVTGRRVQAESD